MAAPVEEARERARALFDAAEYEQSLRVALEALQAAADDVELLVIAGRAGIEVDAPDATDHLRRASELAPQEAAVWHHLGEALATDGRTAEADAAFRRAVELDPDDQAALTHLGHTALLTGHKEEGVGYLTRAADIAHAGAGASTAAISLVEMYRSFGQYEEALAQAQRIAQATGDDAFAWLDVAELCLELDRIEEAGDAFDHLRELMDLPGREASAPEGIETEEGSAPQPEQGAALAAALAEYRRVLAKDRVATGGLGG